MRAAWLASYWDPMWYIVLKKSEIALVYVLERFGEGDERKTRVLHRNHLKLVNPLDPVFSDTSASNSSSCWGSWPQTPTILSPLLMSSFTYFTINAFNDVKRSFLSKNKYEMVWTDRRYLVLPWLPWSFFCSSRPVQYYFLCSNNGSRFSSSHRYCFRGSPGLQKVGTAGTGGTGQQPRPATNRLTSEINLFLVVHVSKDNCSDYKKLINKNRHKQATTNKGKPGRPNS